MNMREQLGHELNKARAARRLSLEAASRAAKISQGYLHKLEAGRVENPSPRVLYRLSDVLGLPYARLMELADYVLPPTKEDRPLTAETTAPATNQELARLLERVLNELAELRRSQEELCRAMERTGRISQP
jgi:transcriptional regulator with XRE-family HTH domain